MITDWQRARDNFDHRTVPTFIQEMYRGDPASLRFISQDYNIVYRFEASGRGLYLRICHESLHRLPEARQVMGFLLFLAREGVPVGAPVRSADGEFIAVLPGGYFASAQWEAPGKNLEHHLLDLARYTNTGGSRWAGCTPPPAASSRIPISLINSQACSASGKTLSPPFAPCPPNCRMHTPN